MNKACFMADIYVHISRFPPKTLYKASTSGDQSNFSRDTSKARARKRWSTSLALV